MLHQEIETQPVEMITQGVEPEGDNTRSPQYDFAYLSPHWQRLLDAEAEYSRHRWENTEFRLGTLIGYVFDIFTQTAYQLRPVYYRHKLNAGGQWAGDYEYVAPSRKPETVDTFTSPSKIPQFRAFKDRDVR